MITLVNSKHPLRSSQPTVKPGVANENVPLSKPKIVLQQIVAGKKAQGIQLPQNTRVFGRNISNMHIPLGKRQRNDLKQDIKNELIRLKRPQNGSRPLNSSVIVGQEPTFEPKPMEIDLDSPIKKTQKKTENIQECQEYTAEIDQYLRQIEYQFVVKPSYMDDQPDVNEKMRAILVDWLVDVHIRFKLLPETLYLTVNLIDRYLEKEHVMRDKLQLVGVTAMLIASKYEEIYPPEIKDFIYITDNAYGRDEILSMEQTVLKVLAFNLNVPSRYRFLQRFSKITGATPTIFSLAQYLIELSLLEMSMLKYGSSIIAASALYVAYKLVDKEASWNQMAAKEIGYDSQNLATCAKEVLALMQSTAKSTLQAIRKKFSSPVHFEVARIKA